MTIAQVVKTSVTVNNSPIQDFVHPDDHTQPADVRLVMETTVIMQVAETKFFGVIIDQHLSCRKPHISFFFQKETVGIITKAGFYLSSKTLLTLYYLTYFNVAWSSTYYFNLNEPKLYLSFAKAHSEAHSKSSLSNQYRTYI